MRENAQGNQVTLGWSWLLVLLNAAVSVRLLSMANQHVLTAWEAFWNLKKKEKKRKGKKAQRSSTETELRMTLLIPVLSRCCLLLQGYIAFPPPKVRNTGTVCISQVRRNLTLLCHSLFSHQVMLSDRNLPNRKQIVSQRWDSKTLNRRGHEKMFFLFYQGI